MGVMKGDTGSFDYSLSSNSDLGKLKKPHPE